MPAREYDNMRRSVRVQRGFTLVELMVTVAVAAIVMVYAVPNMRTFMQHNRVVAQSNSVVADMQYARGQAVSTHTYVSVCPLTVAGGSTCDTSDGNYAQGWIIFTAAAPATTYNGVATSLLRAETAPTTTTVTANAKGIITYDPQGQLWVNGETTPTTPAVFSICAMGSGGTGQNTASVPGTLLNVSSSGRVATTTMPTGNACS